MVSMGTPALLQHGEQAKDLVFSRHVRQDYRLLEVDDHLLQEIIDSGYVAILPNGIKQSSKSEAENICQCMTILLCFLAIPEACPCLVGLAPSLVSNRPEAM
jgi:hypothetical protein